jgi:hypothetical protein
MMCLVMLRIASYFDLMVFLTHVFWGLDLVHHMSYVQARAVSRRCALASYYEKPRKP